MLITDILTSDSQNTTFEMCCVVWDVFFWVFLKAMVNGNKFLSDFSGKVFSE
jgi:hypothetical protein